MADSGIEDVMTESIPEKSKKCGRTIKKWQEEQNAEKMLSRCRGLK
jgi:hypothetical protein